MKSNRIVKVKQNLMSFFHKTTFQIKVKCYLCILHTDVDECSLLYADVCTDPSLTCVNTYGGYLCECAYSGYQMIGNACVGELWFIVHLVTRLK